MTRFVDNNKIRVTTYIYHNHLNLDFAAPIYVHGHNIRPPKHPEISFDNPRRKLDGKLHRFSRKTLRVLILGETLLSGIKAVLGVCVL